jgi:pimeloyl-ACP methyl ester carboxylesterase
VGAGAAVAVELGVSRPKVVRKLYLLGVAGRDTAAPGPDAQALQAAAADWRADRRQLVKQPVLVEDESIEAPALSGKLAEFFAGH